MLAVLRAHRASLLIYMEDCLVERPAPDVCEQLRQNLSRNIKARVKNGYAEQISAFCDSVRFAELARVLDKIAFRDIFLWLSEYVKKAKSLRLQEQAANKLSSAVRVSINRIGDIARHSPSMAAMYAATVSMLLIDLVWRCKRALRV